MLAACCSETRSARVRNSSNSRLERVCSGSAVGLAPARTGRVRIRSAQDASGNRAGSMLGA